MSLQDQISERRKEIRTDGYALSVGEWISLYENGELDIHPEFQRFYRWSCSQKTALIESILLGIPIPSIFVSQREDGIWDVVDGLQRLSTVFEFLGVLKDEKGKLLPPLVLEGTKYLPSLNGVTWEGENSLPSDAKLILKRSKLNVSILLRESDTTTKYDLFQRLNTGGSQASDQEVRNCILVMLRPDMYHWLRKLSDHAGFQETISISDRLIKESYDLELALRFIIFHSIDTDQLGSVGDVGVFLSEKMREMATSKKVDLDAIGKNFDSTFKLLSETLADFSFKRWDERKDRFMGSFNISQYEVVACGIGYNISQGRTPTDIESKVRGLWSNPEYTDWTGSGMTAARRLPRLVPLGRRVFSI